MATVEFSLPAPSGGPAPVMPYSEPRPSGPAPISGDYSIDATGAKMTIENERGTERFTTPFSPKLIEYGGLAPSYSDGDRPGRAPLLLRANDPRPTISFELFVGFRDSQRSVESGLSTLERLARTKERVRIRYGPRESAGLWRIDALSFSSVERSASTNEITRATVSVGLTRAVDVTLNRGPVSGGANTSAAQKAAAARAAHNEVLKDRYSARLVTNARARPGAKFLNEDQFPFRSPGGALAINWESAGNVSYMIYADGYVRDSLGWQPKKPLPKTLPKGAATRVHVWAKGDSLQSVSMLYFGTANAWERIATVNRIRDPKKITLGKRLTIPVR